MIEFLIIKGKLERNYWRVFTSRLIRPNFVIVQYGEINKKIQLKNFNILEYDSCIVADGAIILLWRHLENMSKRIICKLTSLRYLET